MKNWLLVFLWLGFISFLSHQPDLKSDLPGAWDFIFRKLAHFFEFAILILCDIQDYKKAPLLLV